MSLMLTCLF